MASSPAPLPIDEVLPALVESLRLSASVVLQAPTGAGKTTRVPPALLHAGLAGDKLIVMLQPRRLAARAAATRIAAEQAEVKESSSQIGDLVGYQVRFERRAGPATRILVVTDGIFLRMLQDDPLLEQIGAVIFDEFHERNLNSDLSLAMARRVQQEVRPDLKLVVMSATLNPAPIANYLGDCPTHISLGRLFPVRVEFAQHSSSDVLATRVVSAVEQALQTTDGHVLVFLPGVGEIRQASRAIASRISDPSVVLFELFGDMPLDEQQRVLSSSAARKIVLATNVAETSVTIEGVTAVVDTGLARVLRADDSTGINRLEVQRISRASADQRAGRAGRTSPGVCYRLWTQSEQRGLAEFDVPEILRADVAGPLLELLCWGESDVRAFPWFESPSAAAIDRALTLLGRLDAVDERGVTPLGRQMVRLPVHPRIARLLLEGQSSGVRREASLLAAMLSERSPFARQSGGRRRTASHRSDSDPLDRLHALDSFAARQVTGSSSSDLGTIDASAARSVFRAAEQFERLVRADGGSDRASEDANYEQSDSELDESILRCLLAAFPDRLARRRESGGGESGSRRALMVGGRGVRLADESAVEATELFVCVEIEEIGRNEALVRQASSVERSWLDSRHLRTTVEVEYDGERERVVALRRTRFEDLIIDEAIVNLPPNFDAAPLLAAAALEKWPTGWPLDSAAEQYLNRVLSLSAWMPELGLPDFGEQPLLTLLPELCIGCTSLAEIRKAPVLQAIKQRLTHEQQRAVDRDAPERILVPSGSQIALEYTRDQPPVLAVRIQELFGLKQTPRIAGGRVSVLLHLLGPNYRPQQITSDLASFWQNTYPEVRKELRRRYPKHSWPEDPNSAIAESRPGGKRTR